MITRNMVTEYAVRLHILAAIPRGNTNVIAVQTSSGGSSLRIGSSTVLAPVESRTATDANKSATKIFISKILNSFKMVDITIRDIIEVMFSRIAAIETSSKIIWTAKRP